MCFCSLFSSCPRGRHEVAAPQSRDPTGPDRLWARLLFSAPQGAALPSGDDANHPSTSPCRS